MNSPTKTILWVLAGAGAFALFFVFDPSALRYCPPCPFHAMTGLHCPGCGSTRALHQLAHGNFISAFRLNALAILAVPVLGVLLARGGRQFIRPVWIWSLLAVVVVFGVLRNLPWQPFMLLAPHS